MIGWFTKRGHTRRGFLASLLRDRRGNTLAIMAAMLIPLAGMVGGGIDISRMYIVKTRLQHACDAGALAGRKAMGSGVWSQSSNLPRTRANQFFDANFLTGAYGSEGLSRAFTENAGVVNGVASATLPMTLMRVLGKTTETISVDCDAEMRLPNTDVMFVLDITGSMADTPSGDTMSKMASLKVAVKCFYEIVARLDTNATCTTGAPSGGTGNQVQVRFGFMPYATNVNVGKLLPTSYFANSWKYQTRKAEYNSSGGFTWVQRGNPTTTNTDYPSVTNVPVLYCTPQTAAGYGYNTSDDTISNNGNVKTNLSKTIVSTSWATANNGTCTGTRQWVETVYDKVPDQGTFKQWEYDQLDVTVGLLKNGSTWNSSFQWPIGANGTNRTITWDGCIEERPTRKLTGYDPIPSDAYDLDIDLVPTQGNSNSLWGPALQQLIFARAVTTNWNQLDRAKSKTTADYTQSIGYDCPVEAKKLQSWTDPTAFSTYVDSLTPGGNTYHDIGLLWGARFTSATGLFKSENEFTPQGGEIQRNIIFMTDGDACTSVLNYAAYGLAWFDRRQTPDNTAPTDGCTSTGTLTEQVNVRMEALCTAIKNKNITLWVVAFGDLATSTETRLSNCATSGRYFKATNAATLQQTFKQIADQISMLRLTQ